MKLEKLFSRYKPIIADYESFLSMLRKPLVQSFRINTLKARPDDIALLTSDLKTCRLPFYEHGFRLERKMSLGNHPAHMLGLLYIQEIASMLPVLVLDPKPDEVVLDLCAAPGSKTTQIAQAMDNRGLLVVNEVNNRRKQGLLQNIKRCGLLNEVVIGLRGQRIDRVFPDYFDRILIDAPCSAEGTVRKSKAVLFHWGVRNIERMARIQKGLIVSAFRALRPGGVMVYSTCTIAPEENEAVVAYLLERFPEADLLPVSIPGIKLRPGITTWQVENFNERIKRCARVLPQDNDTAPFFIAKISKMGLQKKRVDYLGKIVYEHSYVVALSRRFGIDNARFQEYAVFHGQDRDTTYIATPQVFSFREVRTSRKGLEFGKMYGQDIKPDNDCIQIFGKNAKENIYEMTGSELRRFLKGETVKPSSPRDMTKGFVVLVYKKLPVAIGRYNGQTIKSAVKRDRRIPQ
ncbi:MAG: NOL1/NOP2/sun family putative RNA methylase [candidate division WOR-3 bacterium]|nr:MAG: NOL1/NOP2/sun family putative RNA methylase [candidate division WOR-3 bacterium]